MAGVFSRISSIFQAKANKVLDKAEDPRETLDLSYEKQLAKLTEVRKAVADVATSRKRILTVTADAPLPATGPVTKGGADIGELIATHGDTAFALVRLDRLDQAGGDVFAAGIPVALHRPAWLD